MSTNNGSANGRQLTEHRAELMARRPHPATNRAFDRFRVAVSSRPQEDQEKLAGLFMRTESEATNAFRADDWTFPFEMNEIIDRVKTATNNWPRRVGQELFIEDGKGGVIWLQTPAALFGYLQSAIGVVRWYRGTGCATKEEFAFELRRQATAYDAIEAYPHEPPLNGHYYLKNAIDLDRANGSKLRELLNKFSPATDVDRSLILAYLLTLVWGGAPGQRPAFLFTSDDEDTGRGVGKSTLAKIGARLVGGFIRAAPDDTFAELMPRLLSSEAATRRVALLDNVKKLRFSWGDLEGLITTDVISGKKLYVGEGRRPNTVLWSITLNGANLSTDLAQRCVIIKLSRPLYAAEWEDRTVAFVEANRWEILSDLIGVLRQPADPLARCSRWGAWEKGVLSRVDEPADCQRVIEERQTEHDDDRSQANLVHEFFENELRLRTHDPDRENIWIPSSEAAKWLTEALGEKMPTNRASTMLGTLGVKCLRSSRQRAYGRGWCWNGEEAGQQAMVKLRERPFYAGVAT